MNIRNKIIRLLGGFTKQDYHREITDNNNIDLMPVYSETLNYYIDDDALKFEKEQLAYKIGKEMLNNNLIDFTIKEKEDDFGLRIYSIRAKACVNKIKIKIK